MNPVIAPTDFSPVSRNAIVYAANMASYINAPLILFHVVQLPLSVADTPLSAMNLDSLEEKAKKEIADIKKQLLLNSSSNLHITTRVVVGSIETELENTCRKQKPFAVVMGSEEGNNTNQFSIGTNTLAAVKKLKAPIFIIPPSALFVPFKRIALAADLKEDYKMPVKDILAIVNLFDASLDIVHVAAKESQTIEEAAPAAILQNRLKALQASVGFVINNNIKEGIESFAKKNQDDIVLVLPKKHSFFEFHNRQVKKIALHPALPVLTLPAYIE
ncbi:MAG TPA: universal stress protein [Chitinophagaceae bacterium]|nr:universal stress protein [Chitinophagaceae bacterium]